MIELVLGGGSGAMFAGASYCSSLPVRPWWTGLTDERDLEIVAGRFVS